MSAETSGIPDHRTRLIVRVHPDDDKRIRVLLAKDGITKQDMLTEAVNDWLARHGHKPLKGATDK